MSESGLSWNDTPLPPSSCLKLKKKHGGFKCIYRGSLLWGFSLRFQKTVYWLKYKAAWSNRGCPKKIQCSGALRTAHKGTLCTRFREQSLRMQTNYIQLDWEFRKPIIEAVVDTWAGVSIVLGKKFYNKLKSKPPSRNISLCCKPKLEPNLGDTCCWPIQHQCGSTHTSGWSICSPNQGLDAVGNGYLEESYGKLDLKQSVITFVWGRYLDDLWLELGQKCHLCTAVTQHQNPERVYILLSRGNVNYTSILPSNLTSCLSHLPSFITTWMRGVE